MGRCVLRWGGSYLKSEATSCVQMGLLSEHELYSWALSLGMCSLVGGCERYFNSHMATLLLKLCVSDSLRAILWQ